MFLPREWHKIIMEHTGKLTGEPVGAASQRPTTTGKPKIWLLCPTRKNRKTNHACHRLGNTCVWTYSCYVWKLPWVEQLKQRLFLFVSLYLHCSSHRFLFLILSFRFCKQVSSSCRNVNVYFKCSLHNWHFILLISYFLAKCTLIYYSRKLLTKQGITGDNSGLPHRKRTKPTCYQWWGL